MLVSIATTFFYNKSQESQKSVYINKQATNKMFYVLVDVINATNASMSKNLINYVMYLPILYNNNTVSIPTRYIVSIHITTTVIQRAIKITICQLICYESKYEICIIPEQKMSVYNSSILG